MEVFICGPILKELGLQYFKVIVCTENVYAVSLTLLQHENITD